MCLYLVLFPGIHYENVRVANAGLKVLDDGSIFSDIACRQERW